jgi:hypothetical protein
MAKHRRKAPPVGVRWLDECPSHPEGDEHHECLKTEARCAYCGKRIDPYPCHGCGRFMSAREMSFDDGRHRCDECA